MNVGDVLYWPDFNYHDGGTPTPKLMLIAGIDKYKDVVLFRTTTHDGGYRPDSDGCHADDGVFRFNANRKPFDHPTWIQYEDPYTFSIDQIKQKGIKVQFSLGDEQMRAIVNCLKRSQEFAKWLEDYIQF